jgi:hypothetical protein
LPSVSMAKSIKWSPSSCFKGTSSSRESTSVSSRSGAFSRCSRARISRGKYPKRPRQAEGSHRRGDGRCQPRVCCQNPTRREFNSLRSRP